MFENQILGYLIPKPNQDSAEQNLRNEMEQMATPTMTTGKTQKTTSIRYFDLELFQNKSVKDIKYEYESYTDLEAAKKAVDDAQLLKAINNLVKRDAMMEARKAAMPENAANRALVNDFVNSFGQLPPFDSMPVSTKEEKAEKRGKILSAIKATPFILEGLKQKAKNSVAEDDEDDQDGGDEQ